MAISRYYYYYDSADASEMIIFKMVKMVNTHKKNFKMVNHNCCVPGCKGMVRVVGLGSSDPEFKSRSAVELISRGVNCLSSFRGRQNEGQHAGVLCQSGDLSRIVPNSQRDC